MELDTRAEFVTLLPKSLLYNNDLTRYTRGTATLASIGANSSASVRVDVTIPSNKTEAVVFYKGQTSRSNVFCVNPVVETNGDHVTFTLRNTGDTSAANLEIGYFVMFI